MAFGIRGIREAQLLVSMKPSSETFLRLRRSDFRKFRNLFSLVKSVRGMLILVAMRVKYRVSPAACYHTSIKGGWRTLAEIGSSATLTRRPDLGNASVGTSAYEGSRNGAGPFSCAGKESR